MNYSLWQWFRRSVEERTQTCHAYTEDTMNCSYTSEQWPQLTESTGQCLWKIWSHANKHYGGNHHLFAYNNIIRIWIVLLNTDRAAISYRKVSSFLQLWVIPWQWACLIQCNNSIALLIHVARDGGEYSRDLVGSNNQMGIHGKTLHGAYDNSGTWGWCIRLIEQLIPLRLVL